VVSAIGGDSEEAREKCKSDQRMLNSCCTTLDYYTKTPETRPCIEDFELDLKNNISLAESITCLCECIFDLKGLINEAGALKRTETIATLTEDVEHPPEFKKILTAVVKRCFKASK
jgi:hypothetical protein